MFRCPCSSGYGASLNVAVHSAKTAASHFLSPIFTAKDDYEPFLYIFRTRFSALRATLLSFQADVTEHWNSLVDVDLVTNQTKILGPMSCFLWGCQVLGWQVQPNLVVATLLGRQLHLLLSPVEEWYDTLAQDWIQYAWRKCNWKPDWAGLHVSIHDWRAVWSVAKSLPHFTCKFRVFGLLSGTARAHINHTEKPKCELCGSDEAGQRHLALHCSKTQELRQLPRFRTLARVHPFTMCTGIPCQTNAWSPWESSNQQQPSVHIPGRAIFFTDGSASPPEYAGVRNSTWSVVHAKADSTFNKVSAGLTPGYVHTIARAETYAVLQAIRSSSACDIYVDNQGVFLNLRRICSDGYKALDWKQQANGGLWRQISQAVLTKPQGSIQVTKVKSHRNPGDAKDPKDLWTILGNDHADKVAKDELCVQTRDNHWSTTRYKDYDQYIKDSVLCSEYLHEISKMVFKERKPVERPTVQHVIELQDAPGVEVRYVPLYQQPSPIPETKMWDLKWLQLVLHYFSLLRWPDPDQVPQATQFQRHCWNLCSIAL